MGILENLGKPISYKAIVTNKQQIAEHTFRVTLKLDRLLSQSEDADA